MVRQVTTLNLEQEIIRGLEKESKRRGISRSELAVRLLKTSLQDAEMEASLDNIKMPATAAGKDVAGAFAHAGLAMAVFVLIYVTQLMVLVLS